MTQAIVVQVVVVAVTKGFILNVGLRVNAGPICVGSKNEKGAPWDALFDK